VWRERGVVKRRQLLASTPLYKLLQYSMEYMTKMSEVERVMYQYRANNDILVSQLHWIGAKVEDAKLKRQIDGLNGIKHEFRIDRETVFESTKHLPLLQDIWRSLIDDHPPSTAKNEQWKQLGFQSTEPASDFRSMGIASLKQLHVFSRRPECKSIFNDTIKEYWFPFACVGISITSFISALLENNCLDVYLVKKHDYLPVLYARIWNDFDEAWRAARPSDVMQFPAVWQCVKERIETNLCANIK
jgi:ELMO/CED-12 family protein